MTVRESDFLVVGSGIAGLLAAIKLSDLGTVNLVTKKERGESSTNYAQGGIAVPLGEGTRSVSMLRIRWRPAADSAGPRWWSS